MSDALPVLRCKYAQRGVVADMAVTRQHRPTVTYFQLHVKQTSKMLEGQNFRSWFRIVQ